MLFFLLLVYVDDIIEIISNRIAMIEVKRYYLNKRIRQGTEETTVISDEFIHLIYIYCNPIRDYTLFLSVLVHLAFSIEVIDKSR